MPSDLPGNTRARQLKKARKQRKPAPPNPQIRDAADSLPKPRKARPRKRQDQRAPDRAPSGTPDKPVVALRRHGGKVTGKRVFPSADSYRHYEDRLNIKAAARSEMRKKADDAAVADTKKLRAGVKRAQYEARVKQIADGERKRSAGRGENASPMDFEAYARHEARAELGEERKPDDPVRKRVRSRYRRDAEREIQAEGRRLMREHRKADREDRIPAGTRDAAAVKLGDEQQARKRKARIRAEQKAKRRSGGPGQLLRNAKDEIVDTVVGAPASARELALTAGEGVIAAGEALEGKRKGQRREKKHVKAIVKDIKENDPAYALLVDKDVKEAIGRAKERPITALSEAAPAVAAPVRGAGAVRTLSKARGKGITPHEALQGGRAARRARPALRTEAKPRHTPKGSKARKHARKQVRQTQQREREAARARAEGRADAARGRPDTREAKPRQHSPNPVVRSVAKTKDAAVRATGRDPNVQTKRAAKRHAHRKLNVSVRNVQAAGIGHEERVVTHAEKALPRSQRKSRAHQAALELLVTGSVRYGRETDDLAKVEAQVRRHGGEHAAENLKVLRQLRHDPSILTDERMRKAAKSLAAEKRHGDVRAAEHGYGEEEALEHIRRIQGLLRRGEIRERDTEKAPSARREGGDSSPLPRPPRRDVMAEARAGVAKAPQREVLSEEAGGSAPRSSKRDKMSPAERTEARQAQLRARAEGEVANIAQSGTRHAEGGSGVVQNKRAAETVPNSERGNVERQLRDKRIALKRDRQSSKLIDEFVETRQAISTLRSELHGAADSNKTRIKRAALETHEHRLNELGEHRFVQRYLHGKKQERELQARLDALGPKVNRPAHEATIGGDTQRPVEGIKLVGKPDAEGKVPTKPDPGKLPAGQPGPMRGANAPEHEYKMIDGKRHVKRNGKWVPVRPTARKTGEVVEPKPASVHRRTEEEIAEARSARGPWTAADERNFEGLVGVRDGLRERVDEAKADGDDSASLERDLATANAELDRLAAHRTPPSTDLPPKAKLTPKRVKPAGGEWMDVDPAVHGEGVQAGRAALDDAKRQQELPGRREVLDKDERAVAAAQQRAEQDLARAEALGDEWAARDAELELRQIKQAAADNAQRRRELDPVAERDAPVRPDATRAPVEEPVDTDTVAAEAPRSAAETQVEPEAPAVVQQLAQDFSRSKARFEFLDGTPVTLDALRARGHGDEAGFVRGAKLDTSESRTLGAPEAGQFYGVDDLFQPFGKGRVRDTALEREQRLTLTKLTNRVRDLHAYREPGRSAAWTTDSIKEATERGVELSKQSGEDYAALAIKRPGGQGVEYVLMPRYLARRVSGQLSEDGRTLRLGRWGTRMAVRATLPFSILWHAGNAIDLMTRLALTTPPGSIGAGKALHAALERQLHELSPDLRAEVLDSLKGHFGSRRTVRDPRFADVLRDTRLAPIGTVTNALGDFTKATGGRVVDAAFDFSSQLEQIAVRRAIGHSARSYAKDLGIAVKDHTRAMHELAKHLEADPQKIHELQDRVLEIVGDFATRSATDRVVLAGIDPYWNWLKASTKFVLRTLPEKHPKRTALMFIAASLTDEERAKAGLNYYFDSEELDRLRRDLDYSSQRTGFMSGSLGTEGEGIPSVPLTSFGEVAGLLTAPETLLGRPLSYLTRPATAAAGELPGSPVHENYLRTPGEIAYKALPGGGEVADLRSHSPGFGRALAMASESTLPTGKQIRQVREGGVRPQRDSTFWDPETIKGKRSLYGGLNTTLNFARSQRVYDRPVTAAEMDRRTPKVDVGQEFVVTYEDRFGRERSIRVRRTH